MIGANAVNRHVRDTLDIRTLPDLRNKATALENYAETQGILFGYPDYSGWRSQADTTQLIVWRDQAVASYGAHAWYPVSAYGVGYHGKGAAFDVKVVHWPDGKTSDWAYRSLGAYAPRIGLRWGGTFTGHRMVRGVSISDVDPYHFELAISLDAAQAMFTDWQAAQKRNMLAGKPATVVTPTARVQTSEPLLTFPNFQLPANPAALPKSLNEIGKILTPTGAVPLVVTVALAIIAVGFFLLGALVK